MPSIRVRKETGTLFFEFRYLGLRCREQAALDDTPQNRKRMEQALERIVSEIEAGTFNYARHFPNSKMLPQIRALQPERPVVPVFTLPVKVTEFPTLFDFSEVWFSEMRVSWRQATTDLNRYFLDLYIKPRLGSRKVNELTRADCLAFRASVVTPTAEETRTAPRSASTVNHIMGVLRMITAEASLRYECPDPCVGIKRLKLKKSDVNPFTLEEVNTILNKVRPDFKNYYTVRFYTGMRTGEVHGLKWINVDFERRLIKVRETFGKGRVEYTKNDGSQRDIHMSSMVYEALLAQKTVTGEVSDYVFCSQDGSALDEKNVANRVWYPLLRNLGFRRRRPYETRHTCATLWLASGEHPEWIARQMGHTSTEMLFRVYSRYVPNLTRQDGSAFERMIGRAMQGPSGTPNNPSSPASPAKEP